MNAAPQSSPSSLSPAGLLGDFRLLVMLFVGFRLLLLMAYQPLIVEGSERGLGAGGDRQYHFALAELTRQGEWPFRDWWSEFPPVWYWLTTGVYQLLGENADYANWSAAIGLILLAFDTGNLVLMRAVGTRLYTPATGMALAWIYALTVAPLIFLWWNFETLVAFWLLLGLHGLLRKQDTRSAVAVAIGALTKFTPALLFGAVLRFRKPAAAARYIALVTGLFALVYLPLLAQNAEMTLPSLTTQFGKASYQTVWALIDGNMKTGNFGTVESHFDPAAVEILQGNPPVIPSFVRLAVAGLLGLFVFARTRRFDERGLVAFATITLLIFFLQAQGWSPQWLVQIVPLVLLCFPTRNGVLITLVLSVLVLAEYPVLFIRTGETNGEIVGPLVGPFAALVIARTSILIALCVALYGTLRQDPVSRS